MIKSLLAIVLALFCTHASADYDDWSGVDKKLFIASEALLVADWAQTRQIARSPDRYYETNKILGRHPSTEKVDLYFTTALIGNYYATEAVGEYRTPYLAALTVMQLLTVRHNKMIGLSIAF